MAVAMRKSLEPWIKDEVNYYEHQIAGIRWGARRRSFLCADDMGLGKSLQALTIFAIDVVRNLAETAIVVAPVTLKANWANEIEKFSRFPFILLEGSVKQRDEQLLEFASINGPKILIVNYEQVKGHLTFLNALRFDVAIFDEAHFIKNPKAMRTKAALALESTRSLMLTGTPLLNHVNDLWCILHRIDPEGWPNYWKFVNRYVVFGGHKDKQIVGVKNEKELRERLSAVMIRRLKEDVLDLPEVQITQRICGLTATQRKLYDSVVDELCLPRAGMEKPEDIENALTKYLRLKQICGTTQLFTGTDESAKLDLAVADDVEILSNGHRVVVFTQFRDVLEAYSARMRKLGFPVFELHGGVPMKDRVSVVDTWGSYNEPGALVCMLQVAGVGLNMTQARHGSFLDKLWTPGLNKQAIDRMHRIGASVTQPVQIREYLVRGSAEDRVEAVLRLKSKVSKEIIEASEETEQLRKNVYDAIRDALASSGMD